MTKFYEDDYNDIKTTEQTPESGPSYLTAVIPPSKFPPRHFCAVCGYPFITNHKNSYTIIIIWLNCYYISF